MRKTLPSRPAGGVGGGPVIDKAYDRLPTKRSRELRINATPAERLLWTHLRNKHLATTRFNRQVPIGPYICDFVARGPKLIIELDGGQHSIARNYDSNRTAFLQQHGYRVLRFWNNDVIENVEGVLAVIAETLEQFPPALREGKSRAAANGRDCGGVADRPSPSPSRKAGGELE